MIFHCAPCSVSIFKVCACDCAIIMQIKGGCGDYLFLFLFLFGTLSDISLINIIRFKMWEQIPLCCVGMTVIPK